MTGFSPTPLALSFLSPGFVVAGLILASLPIIIHILNRRRFRTIDWAAMEFLLRAMRKNRKRLRFEQWLLLATRCLVLALLGLALGRLSCSDNTANALGQRTGLHVFVIDNSYSMAYEADRPNAKTHFDQAKKLAEQMIDQLSAGGESVAIITAGQPAAPVLTKPTYDLQQAHSIVDRIPQAYGATDLAGALQMAIDVGHDQDKQPNRNLYVFTDATRSAWQTPQSSNLKTIGPELAKLYHVEIFNLSQGAQWNQAVMNVHPAGNLVTSKSSFGSDFTADLKGFGTPRDATVQWKLDDNVLPGASTISLDANTPPQTQSQAVIKTGGPHVVSVSLIGDDRLKVDNSRSCVVNVAADLKVLIVEGQRGSGPLAGSGAFLKIALAPPKEVNTNGGSASDSYILPELISDLELGNRVLGDYRAVILCGVGQIQPAQADQLAAFVKSGGTLMIFMGEPVASDNYNNVLLPRKLMPGPLTKRMNAGDDQRGFTFDFNPNGTLHPLLKAFANEPKTGLDTAQVFTYWQADVPNDPQLRVLNFRSADGTSRPDAAGKPDPAITVQSLGDGKIVFVSTTANADWTTLPAKPAYVALMQELLAGSVNAGDSWMNLIVGQRLEVPAAVKLTATPTLLDPQTKPIALEQATASDGTVSYRSPTLALPGIYTLTTGTGNVPIAVNVPAEEADVQTIDTPAIKSALGEIDAEMLDDQLPHQAVAVDRGNDQGWNVMFVVLVLVGMEAFLAMRFGHFVKPKS
jgi:von Willebrand factor type A domain/Aerotolerance regulator N-terminal